MSSNFFIGDKDYSDSTRNVDSMLARFKKDRQAVIQMLKTQPQKLSDVLWKYNSPLSKDEECLFQMGKSLTMSIEDLLERQPCGADSMINFYICPQCKNMKRLVDFAKKDPVFMLECGEKAGSSLYFEEQKVCNLRLTLEKLPESVEKAYTNPFIQDLAKCSSATCALPSKTAGQNMLKKYSSVEYLGSDKFTNNMLINWYLSDSVHVNPLYISFVCNKFGYNIYDHLDIGDISTFQEYSEFLSKGAQPSPTAKADDKSPICSEVVSTIIAQLFAALHSWRKHDFSHGNPGTDTMKFKNEVVSYIYDGFHVTSPVCLKLLDFSNSGCTVDKEAGDKASDKDADKIRLYSKCVVADAELKKKTYEPIINTVVLNDTENKVTVYSLRNQCKSNLLFMYMKHLGLPVYSSSFDSYAFMLVLMGERSFYSSLMSDKKLSKFWRHMFINDSDFEKINNRITDFHETSKSVKLEDILSLLKDLSLRCDMTDFAWTYIKTNF